MRRRDQLDLEAELRQLPPPVMPEEQATIATGQRGSEAKNFASAPRLTGRANTTSPLASTPCI